MAHLNSADVDPRTPPSSVPSSSSTLAGPAAPDPEHFHAYAHAEFDSLCGAVIRRLRNDTLPPDEAYWWTRILFAEAVVLLDHAKCEPAWSALNYPISVDAIDRAAA
jgi:hypothetical protein